MFDEPVLGMDVTVRKAAYEVLLRDYTEYPRTIIVSSHLLAEIEGILSEIMLIEKGGLVLYKDIDEMREMAYRADGSRESLDKFCAGKEIIFTRNGEFDNFAIISGNASERMLRDAKSAGVDISQVRPEDLYVYLTQENKEDDLKCLWEK
jgi:ABC-2 type transport system ATP-binding protein